MMTWGAGYFAPLVCGGRGWGHDTCNSMCDAEWGMWMLKKVFACNTFLKTLYKRTPPGGGTFIHSCPGPAWINVPPLGGVHLYRILKMKAFPFKIKPYINVPPLGGVHLSEVFKIFKTFFFRTLALIEFFRHVDGSNLTRNFDWQFTNRWLSPAECKTQFCWPNFWKHLCQKNFRHPCTHLY